jgi:hypothetical protein
MSLSEMIWGAVGFLLTVMILSYLIGDNLFFRLAGHLFIGLTAGYLAVVIIRYILWPHLVVPFSAGDWIERLWLVIPLVLVILLVLSQIPRFSKFGIVPLAFLIGLTAAMAIGGAVFGTLLPQTQAVFDAFDPDLWYAVPKATGWRIADGVVMLLGVVGTLSFFHFGRKWKTKDIQKETRRPWPFELLSKFGQVFIGITLGAVFAGVFSSALLALIDRIFILGDFIGHLFGGS